MFALSNLFGVFQSCSPCQNFVLKILNICALKSYSRFQICSLFKIVLQTEKYFYFKQKKETKIEPKKEIKREGKSNKKKKETKVCRSSRADPCAAQGLPAAMSSR